MTLRRTTGPARRTTAAAVLTLATLGLAACGDEDGETAAEDFGVTVEEVQEATDETAGADDLNEVAEVAEGEAGPLAEEGDLVFDEGVTAEFWDQSEAFWGDELVISAAVAEVLSPTAFTIGADADVEPLLVLTPEPEPVAPGEVVRVTGPVFQALDPAGVAEAEALDGDALAAWTGEPYLLAESVDVSPAEIDD